MVEITKVSLFLLSISPRDKKIYLSRGEDNVRIITLKGKQRHRSMGMVAEIQLAKSLSTDGCFDC